MAAIEIRDAGEEWYIMPSGCQESEETLNEAVCREVSEELGIAVKCKELLFVVEDFHGETVHRVDLIFLVNILIICRMLFFMEIRIKWV